VSGVVSEEKAQPVEKPLAEITSGNMSFTAERLIREKRRGNESKKEALVNNRRDEVDKRAERAVQ
jgi:hypothetical protein